MEDGVRENEFPQTGLADLIRVLRAGDNMLILPAALAAQLGAVMQVVLSDGQSGLLGEVLSEIKIGAASGIIGVDTYADLLALTGTTAPGIMREVLFDPGDVDGSINGVYVRDPDALPDGWRKTPDRVSAVRNLAQATALQVSAAAGGVDGLYAATGAPRPLAFADTAAYALTWSTISNPQTRFTITPGDDGLEVTGLPALTVPLAVGAKLPWDLVPGESYYLEGVYTAASGMTQLGFWFGTDPATTGDISAAARMTVYRDALLTPCLANGISVDSGRTITPAWGSTGALAVAVTCGFAIDVLADRSLRYRVYLNGVQQLVDVVVAPATPVGALIFGLNVINGATGRITKLLRKASPGKTIWIDNTVSASGDGSRGSPFKTMLDVPAYMAKIGYQDEITINWLSDDDYGYIQCKDTLAAKWNLNGRPGGRTRLNGYLLESVVWTGVAGTGGTVFRTPNQWGAVVRSQINQPFVIGVPENPRPWYTFPDRILPLVATSNGGVDMAGLTGGAFATTSGFVYIRLPDGVGPDPATATIRLSRTHYIVEVVGAPEVNLTNLRLQYSSQHAFLGGAGRGVIRNSEVFWSGYKSNGFECQNGSYRFERPRVKYVGNDCIGRTPSINIPNQAGVRQVIEIIDAELSHTNTDGISGGDAISQHFGPDNDNSCETRVINPWIHDIWKCGIVSIDDLMMIEGGVVERCGTAQISLLGITGTAAIGRTQRAFINGTVIDPQGVGTKGVENVYIDGMALMRTDLQGVWIGTPAAGAGNGELVVSAQALAGQTRDPAKNILAYRNCVTERASGSVVKVGGGTAGTFLPVAANPLT